MTNKSEKPDKGTGDGSGKHLQTIISAVIALAVLGAIFLPDMAGSLRHARETEAAGPEGAVSSGGNPVNGESAAPDEGAGTGVDAGKNESPDDADYPLTRDVFLLDTFCELTINAGGGEAAMDSVIRALNYYDDLLNKSKETSDIYKINHRSADRVEVSADTARMLSFAKEFGEESKGVLEPAIGPLTELWDIQNRTAAPSADEVSAALALVKSGAWKIENDTFVALDPDVRIDIGSFGKGFIADRLKDDLISHGVTSAIINLGGNVLCLGRRVDGNPFRIAVREPGKAVSELKRVIETEDDSVVTAGIYERYFEDGGKVYHHILDVSTGYPADNELESVTVVGHESMVCDAICTTVFILGEEAGDKFIGEYNARHGTDYYALYLHKGDI